MIGLTYIIDHLTFFYWIFLPDFFIWFLVNFPLHCKGEDRLAEFIHKSTPSLLSAPSPCILAAAPGNKIRGCQQAWPGHCWRHPIIYRWRTGQRSHRPLAPRGARGRSPDCKGSRNSQSSQNWPKVPLTLDFTGDQRSLSNLQGQPKQPKLSKQTKSPIDLWL